MNRKDMKFTMRNTNPPIIPIKLGEEIIPEMRYKGDISFEKWQIEARAKLKELLGIQFMLPCKD